MASSKRSASRSRVHEATFFTGGRNNRKRTVEVRGTVQSVVNKLPGAPDKVRVRTPSTKAETVLVKTERKTAKGAACYRVEGTAKVLCKGGGKPVVDKPTKRRATRVEHHMTADELALEYERGADLATRTMDEVVGDIDLGFDV